MTFTPASSVSLFSASLLLFFCNLSPPCLHESFFVENMSQENRETKPIKLRKSLSGAVLRVHDLVVVCKAAKPQTFNLVVF
ncbi:hypothetical protein Scep_009508 [Stephania cephalantha]|uniref:Secreted protein n=1 Tax=Stephania cephalantha TaxID=152367 RepID=A0AAP0JTE5_9MAGN